ncbi:MAG: hypothetical protein HY761_11225 [Candidatus Omnitrophica bacterium]|nr:hypothetical protein [Candidatus Omnitrophota bacterium]
MRPPAGAGWVVSVCTVQPCCRSASLHRSLVALASDKPKHRLLAWRSLICPPGSAGVVTHYLFVYRGKVKWVTVLAAVVISAGRFVVLLRNVCWRFVVKAIVACWRFAVMLDVLGGAFRGGFCCAQPAVPFGEASHGQAGLAKPAQAGYS